MSKIICSAIYYRDGIVREHQPENIKTGLVICGRRHCNCFTILQMLYPNGDYKNNCVQGFLTDDDKFYDREVSANIAFKVGQLTMYKRILTSEDLY